ncbi:MAG: class I SAM-dependent RNA methyltransferase [Bacteroidales bacterium]|nr:class I SAM-dependent RNA methyltransferase [Bacteroidales bacterium]
MMSYTIVIKTLFGLEDILKSELEDLGILNIEVLNRAVQFQGSLSDVYKCNLYLRTALNVLVKIKSGKISNQNQLYEFVKKVQWWDYFDYKNSISVNSVSNSKQLNHTLFVSQKTKDGIADAFRDKFGLRPSVDTKNPDIKVQVHIIDDFCSLYLDSTGRPLYIRGFDKRIGDASINEVLAAGIIKLSDWNKKDCFYDPMCGSGTFLTEAYMYAANIPAGFFRDDFCFTNWNNYNVEIWTKLHEKAKREIIQPEAMIIGSDIDKDSIKLAKENLFKLSEKNNVKFVHKDFFDTTAPATNGILITNPIYGKRLKTENINNFYKKIGDKLKFEYTGFTAWIISSDLTAIKLIGMKPDKKLQLFNGNLDCRLHKYSIYKGSKKNKA